MESDQHKLMIVSWTVYPTTTGSSLLVGNLAEELAALVDTVVVGERKAQTHIQAAALPYKLYHVDSYSASGAAILRVEKWMKWMKVRRVVSQIARIATKEQCNYILSVFPDEFYLYCAYCVSKQLNIPLLTWFHNTYLENRQGLSASFAKWLQPRVFSHASINFTISEGLQRFYKTNYPKYRFEPLLHGFSIPNRKFPPWKIQSRPIKFAYTGNLNSSCLDASIRVCKVIIANRDRELHIFGGQSSEKFTRHGIVGDNVRFRGFLPRKKFDEELQKCDVMVLPHGFEGKRSRVEYETIFPTRTIPLLYSGKPILAHTPAGVYLTEFLQKHDCAEIVDVKDAAKIEGAIQRLINEPERGQSLIRNAGRTSSLFDIQYVAAKLKKRLDAVGQIGNTTSE